MLIFEPKCETVHYDMLRQAETVSCIVTQSVSCLGGSWRTSCFPMA